MAARINYVALAMLCLSTLGSLALADVPGKDANTAPKEADTLPAVKVVTPGVARVPGKVEDVPRRDPKVDPRLIDLSNYYTLGLHEDSTGRYGYSLNMIQRGVQKLSNTDYDVRGIVQTGSAEYASRNILFPAAINGIKVGLKCQTLCFLHASRWTEDNGKSIGSYVVHYADGQTREIPILFGIDLRDWDPGHDPGAHDGAAGGPTVAWRGSDKANNTFVLYQKQWANPLPDVQVESIDLVAGMNTAAPFLVALTAQ